MGRRESREEIFRLLFRVEFNSVEEMPQQMALFFEDMDENDISKALSDKDRNPDTGIHYSSYIDRNSFVKKYLVEEVSKNYDAGVSSSFYYKDKDVNGGRLCAAPGWDYDMSLGNYVEWMEEFSADPTGISELAFHTYASPWYTALYQKEDFYAVAFLLSENMI